MKVHFSFCALVLLLSTTSFASSPKTLAEAGLEPAPEQMYLREVVGDTMTCRLATRSEAASLQRSSESMHVIYPGPGQRSLSAGLQITLRSTTQLDGFPAAQAAFVRAAQVWEGKITNPVSVTIDVDFGPTRFGTPYPSPNILGSTSGAAYYVNYPAVRSALVAHADNAAETSLYSLLPNGTVPTDIGTAARVIGPYIQLKTLGFNVPDTTLPSVGFNSAFNFDLDPTNGITPGQYDFDGVTVHEIGHALGFVSQVGAKELDSGLEVAPTIFDVFRFRPGVASGVFQASQRPMSSGGSHVHFAGGASIQMSTGRPDGTGGDEQQSSHWKDDTDGNPLIGLMDPTVRSGFRATLTQTDLDAFAIMGYAIGTSGPVTPTAPTGLTATATSSTVIRLNWTDNSSTETEFRVEQKNGSGTFVDIGGAAANATQINVTGFTAGQTGTFRIRARNGSADSGYSNEASATTPGSGGACTPNATTVCLLNGRFRVSINYVNPFSNPPNQPGTFLAARLLEGVQNPDTGLFGFSSAQAVEVVVRIQDTRPFAPRFDLYYGGMTDVGYTVSVTDTVSGTSRQYVNTVGTVGGGVDRNSFPASILGTPDRIITSSGRDSFEDVMATGLKGISRPVPTSRFARKTVGLVAPAPEAVMVPFKNTDLRAAGTAGGGNGGCSEVEPNDTILLADTLTLGVPCTGSAASTDSGTYTIDYDSGPDGKIHDVFKITTGATGPVTVNLTFTNGSADLDVFLFAVSGSSLTTLGSSTGTSTTESFTTGSIAAGTYYIGVSAYDGSSPYTLTVNGSAPPSGPAAPSGLTATATSSSVIRLNWTDNSNNETEFRVEQKNGGGTFADIGAAAANATQINVTGFTAGATGTFRIRARNGSGDSGYSNEASATTSGGGGACVANSTTVCLLSNRFRVAIAYVNPFSNPPNQPGNFLGDRLLQGVQNPDTGLFGFSSAFAVEVVVRVQDTRPFAPRFDIYYGGMTDVGYTVTVTDTQTGTVRQYNNQVGKVGGGVDRTSFPAN
ncbi:MAG: NF038122 family metalloprotease [Acidobacteriota bacterium]